MKIPYCYGYNDIVEKFAKKHNIEEVTNVSYGNGDWMPHSTYAYQVLEIEFKVKFDEFKKEQIVKAKFEDSSPWGNLKGFKDIEPEFTPRCSFEYDFIWILDDEDYLETQQIIQDKTLEEKVDYLVKELVQLKRKLNKDN